MALNTDRIREQVENFIAMARGENIATRSGETDAMFDSDPGSAPSFTPPEGAGDGRSGLTFLPVEGGRYSHDWGNERSGGRTHKGTDIFAPAGTPVYAAVSGKVVKVGTGGVQQGMVSISIQGADGHRYFYNHLGSAQVQVGQFVSPTTQIASVGNPQSAGYGFEPHLHLGIDEGSSNPIDPFPILQGL